MDSVIETIDWAGESAVPIFLAATIAFVAWLAKSFIEKPFDNARETFFSFAEKRIKILSTIKTHLVFISLSPYDAKTKLRLQELLLKDGSIGFLDKEMLNNTIEISVKESVGEKKLLATITQIDSQLTLQIDKIRAEYSFYIRFAGNSPFKKALGYVLMMVQSVVWITITVVCILLMAKGLVLLPMIWATIIAAIIIAVIWLLEKYLLR